MDLFSENNLNFSKYNLKQTKLHNIYTIYIYIIIIIIIKFMKIINFNI